MDTDFQGAARLGESSIEEEAPGEMPLGTLDRAEMERELSRAKLTFDDDNAQKELVMPVLPSATRLSNVKDFDEAILLDATRGARPFVCSRVHAGALGHANGDGNLQRDSRSGNRG